MDFQNRSKKIKIGMAMDLLNILRRDSRKYKRILGTICLCILILTGYQKLLNDRTVKENILRQNYIVVQTNYRFADKAAFDLKNESYVAMYLLEAVEDGKLYHGYKKVSIVKTNVVKTIC